jgi:hypothetical protein
MVAGLQEHGQTEADDILIGQGFTLLRFTGQGFTLLRFTGQIDSEGRRWLSQALSRQHAHTGHEEYAQLEADLRSFPDDAAEHPQAASGRHRAPPTGLVPGGLGKR